MHPEVQAYRIFVETIIDNLSLDRAIRFWASKLPFDRFKAIIDIIILSESVES
jgi:hypothetical protein